MHWFLDPITKHYFDFDGRATRQQFWMYVLIFTVFGIALRIILDAVHLPLLYFLYSLGLLIPSLAIGTRRLHDIGRSGWWQLIWFLPFVGVFILIVLWVFDSEATTNACGPNPKAGATVPEPAAAAAAAPAVPTAASAETAVPETVPKADMPEGENT